MIRAGVKNGAFIQGGAFRLDKGPTALERHTFRLAAGLHRECLTEGLQTRVGCIVNDLALPAVQRPKATGRLELPEDYVRILRENGLSPEILAIFYESTLRNRAVHDVTRGHVPTVKLKANGKTGVPVAICASIMGRFYFELAQTGYTQQVGFYAREPKPRAAPGEVQDRACSVGPVKGAMKDHSGYELRIEVLNYWVAETPDGILPAVFQACDIEMGENGGGE